MADNVAEVTNTEVTTTTQQPEVNTEVAEMMAISLNGGIAPTPKEETVQTTETTTTETVVPTFEIIKERFGYASPDDAVREIEELRQFKAAPPKADLTFADEQSKKLFEAFKGGKTKEVYDFLAQQQMLEGLTTSEITDDNAGDIIKLGMSLKHKDLTPEEIDYRYKKQFAIPKEPVQTDDELDTEFEERKSEWKSKVKEIQMEKRIEAKLIKPELETAKSNIQLPELEQQVDEGYVQYKKMLEEQPQLEATMKEIYKGFTPKTVETKINFNDETNKIAFEFQYEPDAESFNKSVEMTLDSDKFLASFKGSNGEFDNAKFLKAIHFALNGEKIVLEAIKQAKNATIKSSLPDNSGGTQRQFPSAAEPSELDKQMQMSLAQYMPKTQQGR